MTEVSEETVRSWVKDQVASQDLVVLSNNRKQMFSEAMTAVVVLGLFALVGFLFWSHKSDVEQCAASCGPAGMKEWAPECTIRRPANVPDTVVGQSCVCNEVKAP